MQHFSLVDYAGTARIKSGEARISALPPQSKKTPASMPASEFDFRKPARFPKEKATSSDRRGLSGGYRQDRFGLLLSINLVNAFRCNSRRVPGKVDCNLIFDFLLCAGYEGSESFAPASSFQLLIPSSVHHRFDIRLRGFRKSCALFSDRPFRSSTGTDFLPARTSDRVRSAVRADSR